MDELLLENGDDLELESGSYVVLLESSPAITAATDDIRKFLLTGYPH
jgi:hypothetical protein